MSKRRVPKRPSKHLPGTPGKVEDMRKRHARGESLYHPDDPGMDEFGTARVPEISAGNFKLVGWRVLRERDYRCENNHEPWWGPEKAEE